MKVALFLLMWRRGERPSKQACSPPPELSPSSAFLYPQRCLDLTNESFPLSGGKRLFLGGEGPSLFSPVRERAFTLRFKETGGRTEYEALLFVVVRLAARLAFGHSSVIGNQRVHF